MGMKLNRRAPMGWLALMLAAGVAVGCGGNKGVDEVVPDGETGGTTGDEQLGTGGDSTNNGMGGASDTGGTGGSTAGTGGVLMSNGTGGNTFGQYPVPDAFKMDLLFVIDNSVSMGDKVNIMGDAAARLVRRLASPDCIDDVSGARTASNLGVCAAGTTVEFRPMDDLHVGVITSSLGGSGSSQCTAGPPQDDGSLLLPYVRSGLSDPTGAGYLSWSGTNLTALDTLSDNLAEQFVAVEDNGCGFEAPLEAMYRFLIDPSPPAEMVLDGSLATSTGVDANVLAQRAAFLRPDSLVSIVMLTDEDDCSAMQGGSEYQNAGFGWLVSEVMPSQFGGFPAASDACADDPNSECCYSCLNGGVPEGCNDTCEREESGAALPIAAELDRANVRCFDMKRRFGVDLLYPVERYVDGLSRTTIMDSQTGEEAPNPLFAGGQRGPGWVYLTTMAGVPWQDVATTDTLSASDSLELLSPVEMAERNVSTTAGMANRWDLVLGEPSQNIEPLDPFARASIEPRSGDHPIQVGGEPIATIVPPDGTGSNVINGHEYDNSVPYANDSQPSNDDLQYACIFSLEDDAKIYCNVEDYSCDCGSEPDKNRPLCKATVNASTSATTSQYYEKAYPGPRHFQVIRDLKDRGVLGSTCPKVTDDSKTDFGYWPVMNASIAAMKAALQ